MRAGLAGLVWLAVPAAPAHAAKLTSPDDVRGPHVILTDGCASHRSRDFELSLVLMGEPRPSTLRTTVLFDPALVEPRADDEENYARPGTRLGGTRVQFTSEADAEAGTLSVILNSEGRRPVAELPEGEIARLQFRLLKEAPRNATIEMLLDPGDTISLDGNGRHTHTTAVGPSYLWVGRNGPGIRIEGTGADIRLEARGDLLRDRGWIMRGRIGGVRRGSRAVDLGTLEVLSGVEGGMQAEDTSVPADGDAFFYIVAQEDATGRPIVGFGSDCIARVAPSK